MSNPNKSYFDRYTDPVVREIDRVNIYEFENGMDYELTQSGKAINVDTIKEAQNKVLKNLKKDANFYTNMLATESIKMVGEYGSGKKPGKRETAKSAEAVKKDGKMPKANKQDAPYGVNEKNEMTKVKSLKESLDEAYYLDNASTETDPAEYKDGQVLPKEGVKEDYNTVSAGLSAAELQQLPMYVAGVLTSIIGGGAALANKEEIANAVKKAIARMKGNKAMGENYVPLKDRPVPSKKELDKEWEKRKDGFMKSMGDQLKMGKTNEDVNVKDSRTIKLTPTTKNKILTLVHEMAKKMKEGVAYKVDGEVASFDSDSAAMDFKNKNSNIQTIKKL